MTHTATEDPCKYGCDPADSEAISATEDHCRRCDRTGPVLNEEDSSS
jgi:hypothetical protein